MNHLTLGSLNWVWMVWWFFCLMECWVSFQRSEITTSFFECIISSFKHWWSGFTGCSCFGWFFSFCTHVLVSGFVQSVMILFGFVGFPPFPRIKYQKGSSIQPTQLPSRFFAYTPSPPVSEPVRERSRNRDQRSASSAFRRCCVIEKA